MATWDLRDAVNISTMELPPKEDEFTQAGVTKADCIDAPGKRVAESPCHYECKYLSTQRYAGRTPVGSVDVVFGEVISTHIKEDVVSADGKLDIPKIKPIARMGYYDYTVVDNVFEMKVPGAEQGMLYGLEGRTRSQIRARPWR